MRGMIAFDLDGVLYTSEPFLGEAYREAIANVNARRPGSFPRVPSTREILDHVGWPVPVILERLFPCIESAAVELLSAETLAVICTHVARREGKLFPGVAETLAALRTSGFLLAVASNGRGPYVETVLRAHDLKPHFVDLITVDQAAGAVNENPGEPPLVIPAKAGIHGAPTPPPHLDTRVRGYDGTESASSHTGPTSCAKPAAAVTDKADVLRAYLARHLLTSAEVIMVGDRASDVEAAAAVGCRFIGCDYGHGHRDEIEAAGPVVSSFDQLLQVVPDIVAAAAVLPNRGARS